MKKVTVKPYTMHSINIEGVEGTRDNRKIIDNFLLQFEDEAMCYYIRDEVIKVFGFIDPKEAEKQGVELANLLEV